jgi:hypothetical protein
MRKSSAVSGFEPAAVNSHAITGAGGWHHGSDA